MSAYPFGGHPTLAQYIAWARTQGCKAQSGVMSEDDGTMVTVTKIVAPSGRWVVASEGQTERLDPSSLSRLDRRLGLKSPFSGVPTID